MKTTKILIGGILVLMSSCTLKVEDDVRLSEEFTKALNELRPGYTAKCKAGKHVLDIEIVIDSNGFSDAASNDLIVQLSSYRILDCFSSFDSIHYTYGYNASLHHRSEYSNGRNELRLATINLHEARQKYNQLQEYYNCYEYVIQSISRNEMIAINQLISILSEMEPAFGEYRDLWDLLDHYFTFFALPKSNIKDDMKLLIKAASYPDFNIRAGILVKVSNCDC